ncbi:MAG: hypothetical protein LBF15_03120 [Candidatus Peribacteria bacterium]|jgi:hypothetical protein|nr:hypothetical protein [Candidatus Peribacteria bacterium]
MSICTRNFDKIPNLKDFILKNVEYERVKVIKVNGTNLSSYNNPFDFLEKSQQVREEKEFREEQKNYPLIYLGELDNLWRCIIYKCQIIGKIVDCTTNSLTLANKLD